MHYNYHSRDFCGWANNNFELDVLSSEFNKMGSVDNEDTVNYDKKY